MFDNILYDILLYLVILVSLFYLLVKEKHGYFKRRGIPYNKPIFLLGNTWRNILGRENLVDACSRIYNENPDKPFVGVYQGLSPFLLLRDPNIIEKVIVTEFSSFHDRGIPFDENANPLEGSIFNLTGMKWRAMRNKLLPSFTSGKLKGMLTIMQGSIKSFVDEFENELGHEIETKTVFSRLNFHIIGTCAFGLDLDTIKNPDSKFPKMCKKIFARDPLAFAKGAFRFFFPKIAKFLKLRIIAKETNDFFMNMVKDGFDHRTRTGFKRNDFMQLLLELRDKGKIDLDERDEEQVDEIQDNNEDFGQFAINDEVLTAQAFGFFAGGFETSSTALSFIFYLLSKNYDVQEKLRKEVYKVKEKYGSFTYEALKAMTYTDACINESLRMYPPVGVLVRKVSRDIALTQELKLDKDILIFIPIYSVQRDEAYFDNPLTFDPERFVNMTPGAGTFLPFGDGPRICIAQRFANLQMKAIIAEMLSKFKVETCDKMAALEPIKLLPRAFVTTPKDGLFCVFKKLSETNT